MKFVKFGRFGRLGRFGRFGRFGRLGSSSLSVEGYRRESSNMDAEATPSDRLGLGSLRAFRWSALVFS